MAQLDTGANTTVISHEVVTRLGLSITPKPGTIELADVTMSMPRIGMTDTIMITCGGRTIHHQCEVLNLSDGIDMLIGRDILSRFGIAISGLPTGIEMAERLPEPEPDERLTIKPLVLPESELTAEFNIARENFMKEIRDALEENQRIPLDSFCMLPESVMYLHTPKGKYAFRRQYPIPFALEPIVDKAVQKW